MFGPRSQFVYTFSSAHLQRRSDSRVRYYRHVKAPKANERKITQRKKKLTRLVPLAFDVTRVSGRSRTSEPHMLSWKQHGESLCRVRCGTNSSQKSSISTFTFPKVPQNVRRTWINFVKMSQKTFQCRQATTWSVRCISPRAVSTISLLLTWELRLGIGGDSWTKM